MRGEAKKPPMDFQFGHVRDKHDLRAQRNLSRSGMVWCCASKGNSRSNKQGNSIRQRLNSINSAPNFQATKSC